MNSNIYKEAAIKFNTNKLKNIVKAVGNKAKTGKNNTGISKGVGTNVDNFKKNLENSGLNIKGGQSGINKAVSDLTKSDFGAVGMLGEGIYKGSKKVYKKIPDKYRTKIDKPLKNFVDKSRDVRNVADKAVTNANMKAGEFGYKHAPGKSKNLFVQKKKIELDSKNPTVRQYGEFGITKGTEPLNKAKKVALPIIGASTISNQLENLKYRPNEDQEKNVKKVANEDTASIDKVANIVENKIEEKTISKCSSSEPYSREELAGYFERMSKLASDASTQLMLASYIRDTLIEKNSSLEDENKQLKIAFDDMKKSSKVEKLAKDMMSRGMLVKSDYQSKVEELRNLDDNAFNLFKEAIYKMPYSQNSQGIDKLSYAIDTPECNVYDTERKKKLYETFNDN